jgi:hypothetical protein
MFFTVQQVTRCLEVNGVRFSLLEKVITDMEKWIVGITLTILNWKEG